MDLDSYTYDLCILQKLETVTHLSLQCNFAKACWNSVSASFMATTPIFQIFSQVIKKLAVPFFMEAIILMTLSILDSEE